MAAQNLPNQSTARRRQLPGCALLLAAAGLMLLIAGEFGPRLTPAAMSVPVVCNESQTRSAVTPGTQWLGYFTNYGSYLPRLHCVQTADGRPDWPWITALLICTALVVIGYLRIFVFWLTAYFQESREDRNRPLFDLAVIFLFCAICGYATAMLFFVWPAYRLLVFLLIVLTAFTWRFVFRLDRFRISLQAKRLHRELHESLQRRNEELEALVADRTAELERARAAADASNAAKSTFLANMSHEIRTPMTAILGYADLLADQLADPTHRDLDTQAIDTIRRNGSHLLTIINDVLDLSRVEANRVELEPMECSPLRIIEDTVSLLKHRAMEKGIALRTHYLSPLPAVIRTDPVRMKQVLVNVIGNAVKFTEEGEVRIDISFADPKLTICVVDTGIGMAPEALEHIFNPFQQADSSTVRRFGGTGLGLTISRRLIRHMGGELTATSAPGCGSAFRITLPVDKGYGQNLTDSVSPESPADAPAPLHEDPLPALRGRILLAEDGPDNQRLIAFHLRRAGAEVEIVENGQLAVESAASAAASGRPFDLVVLDMQMPVMDGYTAARRLRAAHRDLPIIALTAHAMNGDRNRCIAAGCSDFATKPFDRNGLIRQCAALLRCNAVQSGHEDERPIASAGKPVEVGRIEA